MVEFLMRVSDCTVAVRTIHDLMMYQAADYLIPSHGFEEDVRNADITADIAPADIDHERTIGEPGDWDDAYLETLAVFRKIAEAAPAHQRLVFHGATITFQDRAYIFTAPSGTGKTTHIRLWKQEYGDRVDIINGDKPILRVTPDAGIVAYGTPWAGKERWQRNTSAPVAGICIVTRATDAQTTSTRQSETPMSSGQAGPTAAFTDDHGIANTCTRIDTDEALPTIIQQTYLPSDPSMASATLDLLDTLLRQVPVYRLACTISKAAVHASTNAMIPDRR